MLIIFWPYTKFIELVSKAAWNVAGVSKKRLSYGALWFSLPWTFIPSNNFYVGLRLFTFAVIFFLIHNAYKWDRIMQTVGPRVYRQAHPDYVTATIWTSQVTLLPLNFSSGIFHVIVWSAAGFMEYDLSGEDDDEGEPAYKKVVAKIKSKIKELRLPQPSPVGV